MPGFLLHQGATVKCSHGGQATPTAPNPRVLVGGQPTVMLSAQWSVAGCPGVTASSIPPCATGQWTTGTLRVTSNGQPLVVQTGQAVCAPTGTPLLPVAMQTRVSAM